MKDRFGRNITYLRISVTDLCNLRCKYCMPESGVESLCHSDILSIEEIVEIVKIASKNGIKKIRLTGGEPLVRRGFINLCKEISKIDEIEDIAITTNGVHLKEMADELFENKVRRINFSLDTLVKEKYNDITRRNDFDKTMESLFYAIKKGFKVKINVVLIGGFNDDEIEDFVNLANKYDLEVRFIELMQIGETANWSKDKFISNKVVLEKVPELEFDGVSGVAKIYKIKGQKGRIGLISPISCSFCEDCNRIRLTSDGKLKPCLHSSDEINLKGLSGEELEEVFKRGIYEKPEKHHLEDGKSESARDMNKIGG
ncbi:MULTISPECIES: GTP 3',8-cyclase MoaA [unclassified Parvimonas]|uniref:GTP 3',8-cyclase MoaA n=1 Tax=unclassified Parvimonas TaxID=1151464 RepID=UPI002B497D75|nr:MULTISPECIES: GTP 3',8-cyclase MoaA [unclassified Parvimonas]MEB3025018.1 GTP 3',8-cyclase MoaA [Parvimonas sp. M13]MEB3073192.1 GTP 3',8-cyclase MoaA [Parvimonas sp. C2]MEB3089094.1 GTP 3',8-cyclase MoaA [Parvimonas sp. M20]